LEKGIGHTVPVTVVRAGEDQKKLEMVEQIWNFLINFKFDRKSLLLNLGGGMVNDLGGFAAGTYKRGIDFMQIPTTVMSQVDASIGGKTAINYANLKNMIGTFTQPAGVIIDTRALKTMTEREYVSGFAEIIKHGLIKNPEYFNQVTAKHPNEFNDEELIQIVAESCLIKAQIVQADEQESGLRKTLNFGHTIGHVLEALSQESDRLRHGEAVAIGMIAEAKLSVLLGLLSESDFNTIEATIIKTGLPSRYPYSSVQTILDNAHTDKKNTDGHINWTLLKGIGQAVYDVQADDSHIRAAIQYVLQ
jgi:3-dehydroquinate synthase